MNQFIWTDLSTYHLEESVAFYRELFGWKFTNANNYFVGGFDHNPEIGIYETPAFFQKIKMPHFWMNYIQIEDHDTIVKKAAEFNGKVELMNEPFYGGKIALIRDPMGAGFTVYQGSDLAQTNKSKADSVQSRELHTSDANAVLDFYQKLFSWNFEMISSGEFLATNSDGKTVCSILELDNSVKGKYEYWVTEFVVNSLEKTLTRLESLGGKVISKERSRILATDQFGEAFFYIASR